MSEFAIQAEGIGKRYRIGARQESYRTLRDTLSNAANWRSWKSRPAAAANELWALRDVSFNVKEGETLGIIGRNGAGKSTLLKVLSRVTEPTRGSATTRGRVGSLLEVGTGFHPELTGRENIFLNGAILGMARAEIVEKFDRIVDFAEVERFIDTPVKHYSSGMYLRLAFSVAAHMEPSILLVDEVLAVGDFAFQRKCMGRMQEVGAAGQTVVFVSHDLTAIARLASSAMILKDGQIAFFGPTEEAVRLYTTVAAAEEELGARRDRIGDGLIRMTRLRMLDHEGRGVDCVGAGDPLTIAVDYESQLTQLDFEDVALDMRFTDAMGHPITTLSTRFSRSPASAALPSAGTLTCQIPCLNLAEETYGIDLWLAYRGGVADEVRRAVQLRVAPGAFFGTGQEPVKRKHGAALVAHEWTATESNDDRVLPSTATPHAAPVAL